MSLENYAANIASTLKSHADFKFMWLLQGLSQYHEILHAKSAVQDLFGSFFRSWKLRYVNLEYLKTCETPCMAPAHPHATSVAVYPALFIFSRGHGTLHLAVSVGPSIGRSVTFLNSDWFLHYCSCPTVRDWIAVYPALFFLSA